MVSNQGDRVEVVVVVSFVIHLVGKSSIMLLDQQNEYFCIFMPTSGSHIVLHISKVLLSQLWMSTDIVLIYPLRCYFADQALSNFVIFGLFLEFFNLLFSGVQTNIRSAFRGIIGLPKSKIDTLCNQSLFYRNCYVEKFLGKMFTAMIFSKLI